MNFRKTTAFTVGTAIWALCAVMSANAAPIYWTDWTTGSYSGSTFTGNGTITTQTATINVTYTNPQGVGFFQSSGGTNYWTPLNAATSPYTSSPYVDNYPGTDGNGNPTPGNTTDIIALRYAGNQTLTFSQSIANPVFAFVSLNGNGYAFDQDFDILSVGNNSPGNDCGYWGCGSVTKQVVDVGGGNLEYRLIGSGEPHGTIRFTGAFSSVTWRSLTNEYWNGFTVGVQGTAAEVLVPLPSTLLMMGTALAGLVASRRRRL